MLAARDHLAGRTVGEFVLRERIGEGSFGAVYRCEQPLLGREAVVKVLHTRHRTSEVTTQRFMREARLATRLDHPYAAHVYAFGVERDGLIWIAMELVRGTRLDELLRRRGPLPPQELAPFLDRMAEVVQTAHERGIVHRDLKPSNVMVLERAGQLLPKLLDFGIAKLVEEAGARRAEPHPVEPTPPTDAGDDTVAAAGRTPRNRTAPGPTADTPTDEAALTQVGMIMGSPPYMAPELWADSAAADARSDLYALAVVAYETLTGRRPFEARSGEELARAHAQAPVPPLGPAFPPALDAFFARALAKGPDDRFQRALELAAAFRVAAGLQLTAELLPRLEPSLRDALLVDAPQPLAETVVALDAARNAHQARDALWDLVRVAARLTGIYALAARSRLGPGPAGDPDSVVELLRALRLRRLDDEEWVALARGLCLPHAAQPALFPIPELVALFFADGAADPFAAVFAHRSGRAGGEEAVREQLARALPDVARLMRALAFLSDLALVVPRPELSERWMGIRRARRAGATVQGEPLPLGKPVLLDGAGHPVLALWPLVQVAPPAPGVQDELFFLEGSGRFGARLVALPLNFEHQAPEVWDWWKEHLQDGGEGPARVAAGDESPWPGLSAFSTADAARYVGREREVASFVNRLRAEPLLIVVGPSGAGKSSFVQAGVIPSLPEGWRAVTVRPGAAPLAALAARLAAAGLGELGSGPDALGTLLRAAGDTVVLVVDQLEELFTLCRDPDEQHRFAELVARAARAADEPARVIFTLRDDFLMKAEALPALRGRLTPALTLLGTPGSADLLRILVEPARRAGYHFDDGELAARMVDELADRPGALALLSFTAARLWEQRDRHFKQLPRKAYEALGGVAGALAQHAEQTLAAMLPEDQRLVREAFRHLTTADGTRAVMSRAELEHVLGGARARGAVESLIAARLLVAREGEGEEDQIEIVHEALLTAWPRAVEWRRADAEGARLRDQLRAASRQWETRGRRRGLLWRDEALAELRVWRARHPSPLTEVEEAFSRASVADAARGRRLRGAAIGAVVLILSAAVVVLVRANTATSEQRGIAERRAAEARQSAAEAQRLLAEQYEEQGRLALLSGRAGPALAFFVEALRLGAPRRPALDLMLAQAEQPIEQQLAVLAGHTGKVLWAEFSPDGGTIVTAGQDGKARLWDATGRPLATLAGASGEVWEAHFDPTGERVLTSSVDGMARIYARDGTIVHRLVAYEDARGSAEEPAWSAAFSPDGKLVATGGLRGQVRIWNAATGAQVTSVRTQRHTPFVLWSPRGDRLVTAGGGLLGGTVNVWNARTGAAVAGPFGHDQVLQSVRISGDGKQIVTASWDKTAKIWDAATGKLIVELAGHSDTVNDAVFSPDGTMVVTASRDRTMRVWQLPGGRLRLTLEGHAGAVEHVAFDRSGARLVSASADGSAAVWDMTGGAIETSLQGPAGALELASFSPDGLRVVTAGSDGTARLWSTRGGMMRLRLAHRGPVPSAQLSPDGKRIVTASRDATARVWDAATGEVLSTAELGSPAAAVTFLLDGSRFAVGGDDGALRFIDAATGKLLSAAATEAGAINDVIGSPDRRQVLTLASEGAAQLWDARTGERVAVLGGHAGSVEGGAFSGDGSRIVTAGGKGSARLWDAGGRLLLTLSEGGADLTVAAVSPDGAMVATGGYDSLVRLWSSTDGHLVRTLAGHSAELARLQFSPDGRLLASASADSTAKLWKVDTGELLGSLAGHSRLVLAASFSPDGSMLVTAGDDGTARVWETASMRQVGLLAGHSKAIWRAAFGADGAQVLTAGLDGSAVLWQLAFDHRSLDELATFVSCRVPFKIVRGMPLPISIANFRCGP